MGSIYAPRKRAVPGAATASPLSDHTAEAPRTGARISQLPTEQPGRRVDLPEAMRAKMENAFGADLSSVRLYESEAVGRAGAEAVTQGRDITFAPGMLDFTSFGGQALLGHELSHVLGQARGEVSGGGFLHDPALEARADREGAMAASGQQIALPSAPLSAATAAAAAGPMQAKMAPGRKWEDFESSLARQARTEQRPDAEAEADRLSAFSGVGGSQASVKAAMGERLGADFSSVRFHTGAAAAARADAMGARAYTSGSDVFFGSGGFDPAVAAHELVHTVQQGAVAGSVPTVSAPAGGVQMIPVSVTMQQSLRESVI